MYHVKSKHCIASEVIYILLQQVYDVPMARGVGKTGKDTEMASFALLASFQGLGRLHAADSLLFSLFMI